MDNIRHGDRDNFQKYIHPETINIIYEGQYEFRNANNIRITRLDTHRTEYKQY